jgi:5-methylcytosine-specific restriction endonuclease McrA
MIAPWLKRSGQALPRCGSTSREEQRQGRLCSRCKRRFPPEQIVYRTGKCRLCLRAYERERSVNRRARRVRNSVAWQKIRAQVRQRDGNGCRECGSSQQLQVHHIVPLSEGGDEFALSNS